MTLDPFGSAVEWAGGAPLRTSAQDGSQAAIEAKSAKLQTDERGPRSARKGRSLPSNRRKVLEYRRAMVRPRIT